MPELQEQIDELKREIEELRQRGNIQGLERKLEELEVLLLNHPHDGMDTKKLNNGTRDVMMSFETGEQTATKLFFPFGVEIMKIRGIVMKAIAATDDGTITGANETGDSTGGVITATASDALNTEYSVSPTTNTKVGANGWYKLTSAKTTAGGKVLVSLEYRRT